MPRVTHTAQLLSGPYPAGLVMDTLTFTAADVTNKEEVVLTDREILIARNTHGSTTYNVTITSVADAYGRVGNVTKAIAAGAFAIFGPIKSAGWQQSNGKLYFEADNAAVTFAVVRLPA